LAIDILTGFAERTTPPVAGTTAMEMAISMAKIVRATSMSTDYLATQSAGQRRRR
jgi:hypothetical protein